MESKVEKSVALPEGYGAKKESGAIVISHDGKELRRVLPRRNLDVDIKEGEIVVSADKKHRALVGTFVSHFRNMVAGLEKDFVYKLKICSSHFPMTAKKEGSKLVIQNFMGSSASKFVKLVDGVDVSVDGDVITVKSADIELAGRVASDIEQATHLSNKDRRVFQDGVFITHKAVRGED